MKKILINYADDNYKKTQKVNSWTGINIAKFDKVYSFSPKDIDEEFYNANKKILDIKRGNGLWLWKPYFIYKVLLSSHEGDIIFYCDSGAFFIRKIEGVIDSMKKEEKIWVSDIPLLESCFTKPKCFELLNCTSDDIKYSNQIQGTFFMAVCCEESKRFVKEWLEACRNYDNLEPEGNLNCNKRMGKEFVVHREDQSLLSILCKKYNIKPHLDPSQRGRHQETYYNPNYEFKKTKHNDKYRPIIFLHKKSEVKFSFCLKIIVRTYVNKLNYYIKEKKCNV